MPTTVRMTGATRSLTTSWLTSVLIGRCTPSQASIGSIQTPPASSTRRARTVPDGVSSAKPDPVGTTPRTGSLSRTTTPASIRARR